MRPSDLGKPDGLGGGTGFLAEVLVVYSRTGTSPGRSLRYIGTL